MKTEAFKDESPSDYCHLQPDVTKTEHDSDTYPTVEVIVVEPRGEFGDLLPNTGQLERVNNHVSTKQQVSGSRDPHCEGLIVNGSDVLPSASSWCRGICDGFREHSAGEAHEVKTEDEVSTLTGSCLECEMSLGEYRMPYIVVAPEVKDTQEEMIVKSEWPTSADAGANDDEVKHQPCPASPSFLTARLQLSASLTGPYDSIVTGTASVDVDAGSYVDIPRTCRIPVVVPQIIVRYPANSRTVRSYFVTVTYNHAGEITQLDTRFDRVPEGRYFVVASKPNFPSEVETAVVHGYLAPAASGARAHARDRNFAIVDIEYPRSSGGETVATPSESTVAVDRRHQSSCVHRTQKKGKARWSRDSGLSRRKRAPADGNRISGRRVAASSLNAERCADISVFMCRAVQSDRVKYARVIMRLANELGVAACVHHCCTVSARRAMSAATWTPSWRRSSTSGARTSRAASASSTRRRRRSARLACPRLTPPSPLTAIRLRSRNCCDGRSGTRTSTRSTALRMTA